MKFEAFSDSLTHPQPPGSLTPLLSAMWWDAAGDWHQAHEIAQDVHDAMGSLVHAYLHRKEGDLGNARYWYRSAGRPEYQGSLDDEWQAIVRELLGD